MDIFKELINEYDKYNTLMWKYSDKYFHYWPVVVILIVLVVVYILYGRWFA